MMQRTAGLKPGDDPISKSARCTALELCLRRLVVLLTSISVWNLVEVHVGIMAACAPMFRPVLIDIFSMESFVNLLHSVTGRPSTGRVSRGKESLGFPSLLRAFVSPSYAALMSRPQLKHTNHLTIETQRLPSRAGGGDMWNLNTSSGRLVGSQTPKAEDGASSREFERK